MEDKVSGFLVVLSFILVGLFFIIVFGPFVAVSRDVAANFAAIVGLVTLITGLAVAAAGMKK